MENMKAIIRREYDPYRKEWGYIAVFPEESANHGKILALPFYFRNDGTAVFEAHGEIDLGYYYKTKIVHAKSYEAEKCRLAVESYYNSIPGECVHLRIVEKILR